MTETKTAPNRTVLRHKILTAVASGQVTMVHRAFWFGAQKGRQFDLLREDGYIEYGDSAFRLSGAGQELLAAWDAETA